MVSEFSAFSAEWGFTHVTSSPRYVRSNGAAENAVKRFKTIMRKKSDPYMALLNYRATPLQNGYSPSQLCMNRRLRTTLPVAPHTLESHNTPSIRDKEEDYRRRMKENYDTRHRARELSPINPGDTVVIKDMKTEGTVVKPADNAPRSHVIATPKGEVRRNRRHLNKLPEQTESTSQKPNDDHVAPTSPARDTAQSHSGSQGATRTRSGRVSKPPDRLHTHELEPNCK